jgi:DNA invertase Pin-like site-specific DNA recombinase
MSYLNTLQGTTGDAFNKLAEDAQNQLKQFEDEIRADERKKVLTEIKKKVSKGSVALLKPPMIELLEQGISRPEIAKLLGVGKSSVYRILEGVKSGNSKEL